MPDIDISIELNNILSAKYGKDVRQSIHDGIKKIKEVVNDTGYTELIDIRESYDGGTYESAGMAVRDQIKSAGAGIKDETISPQKMSFFSVINLYNKDSNDILNNKVIHRSGSIVDHDNSIVSHKIPIDEGVSYKFLHTNIASIDSDIILYINSDDQIMNKYMMPQKDGFCVFTAPKSGFIRINVPFSHKDEFMFCKTEEYPEIYVGYEIIPSKHLVLPEKDVEYYNKIIGAYLSQSKKIIDPTLTTFVEQDTSDNLFDKNSDNILQHKYFNTNGTIEEASHMSCIYMNIGIGDYCFDVAYDFYGSNNSSYVPLFDRDKRYIETVSGSLVNYKDAKYSLHVNITDEQIAKGAVYIGFTVYNSLKDSVMFVHSSSLPEKYVSYYNKLYIPNLELLPDQFSRFEKNPLYGKIAVFDGDSICHGTSVGSTDETYGWGWAGRIGTTNNMEWYNEGRSGGTITSETYSGDNKHHWIAANIENIHDLYPALDYLILEGGTNDADLLEESSQFGTFNATDYSGTYDINTFCGALESLFYKAISYFPGAKIGYIVAQKMGYAPKNNANYTDTNKRRKYFLQAIQICKKWGIPYLDLWDCCYLNPSILSMYDRSLSTEENIAMNKMYTDGQHLTSKGYDYISSIIEDWMKGI